MAFLVGKNEACDYVSQPNAAKCSQMRPNAAKSGLMFFRVTMLGLAPRSSEAAIFSCFDRSGDWEGRRATGRTKRWTKRRTTQDGAAFASIGAP